MENNENVVVAESEVREETAVSAEETKESFGAKVKEWLRKRIVNLKRKPQSIAFLMLLVASVFYLLSLNTLSPGPVKDFRKTAHWLGFCIFVNALFSILVLVLFMNTFPKHPKVNKKTGKKHRYNFVMAGLAFAFIAVMIVMDCLFYNIMVNQIAGNMQKFFGSAEQALKYQKYWPEGYDISTFVADGNYMSYLVKALHLTIAHIVLLGVSALLFATLPLYRKLILKINTSKEVEGNNADEVIDIEED